MRIKELKRFVKTIVEQDKKIPVMIWSAPGIGKSASVKQVAQELGIGFIDLRLSLLNPVDLRGLPLVNRETHKAEWLPPDFLPGGDETPERGILFLDEINLAPASVMAAGYQLILDRELGEYKLPNGWVVIAAGNRAKDQANVTKFPTPLANRLVHVELEPDVEEWRLWAFSNNIAPEIIAFISKLPQFLFEMPRAGEVAFPTPRSWENASKLFLSGIKDISPSVGEGVSAEFNAFLNVYKELPDIQEVLTGKTKQVPNKEKLDATWALCTAIITSAKKEHLPFVFPYIAQLSKEFEVLVITGIYKKGGKISEAIANSEEFSVWVTDPNNKSIIEED